MCKIRWDTPPDPYFQPCVDVLHYGPELPGPDRLHEIWVGWSFQVHMPGTLAFFPETMTQALGAGALLHNDPRLIEIQCPSCNPGHLTWNAPRWNARKRNHQGASTPSILYIA
jgi:hypothetical protein